MHRPLLPRAFPALGLPLDAAPLPAAWSMGSMVRVGGAPPALTAPADVTASPAPASTLAMPSTVALLSLGILAIPLAAGGYLIYKGSLALGVGVIVLGPGALMIAAAAGLIALGGLGR